MKIRELSEASNDPLKALRAFLSALPTTTATASFLRTIVRLLLLHTARSTASSHLLLGTSLTSLSISLISSIAQGGGFNVRDEMGEMWHDVRLVKPLRDLGGKECAFYSWWNNLNILAGGIVTNQEHGIGSLTKGGLK